MVLIKTTQTLVQAVTKHILVKTTSYCSVMEHTAHVLHVMMVQWEQKEYLQQPTNAGTFGGTHDGNMSVHLTDGTVTLKLHLVETNTDTGNMG